MTSEQTETENNPVLF